MDAYTPQELAANEARRQRPLNELSQSELSEKIAFNKQAVADNLLRYQLASKKVSNVAHGRENVFREIESIQTPTDERDTAEIMMARAAIRALRLKAHLEDNEYELDRVEELSDVESIRELSRKWEFVGDVDPKTGAGTHIRYTVGFPPENRMYNPTDTTKFQLSIQYPIPDGAILNQHSQEEPVSFKFASEDAMREIKPEDIDLAIEKNVKIAA